MALTTTRGFDLWASFPVMPAVSGMARQASNGRITHVIHPLDIGASGGKVRPIERYESGMLAESAYEHSFTYREGALPVHERQYLDETKLCQSAGSALSKAFERYSSNRGIKHIATVDTMGACLKIMRDNRTFEPLVMYTDEQRIRGMEIIAGKLTGGDKEALLKKIHADCGGQSWVDVYNLYHLAAINERNPIPGDAVIMDIPGVIENFLCRFSAMHGQRPVTEASFGRVNLWGNLEGNGLNVDMIEKLGLPLSAFPEIVPSGTFIGETTDRGFPGAKVVAAGTHDTAGSFAVLKMLEPQSVVLSTGSWNLVGLPIDIGKVTPQALETLFNMRLGIEGATGAETSIRNVRGGMLFDDYLIERRSQQSMDELFRGICGGSVPFSLINLDSPNFHYNQGSGSVSPAVAEYCKATGQEIPNDMASMVKTLTISMVLGLTDTVMQFQKLAPMLGTELKVIQAGGGLAMNNHLMMQSLADATGLPVRLTIKRLSGFGNAAIALVGTGEANIEEIRRSLSDVSANITFEPYDGAHERWVQLHDLYKQMAI